MGKRRNKEKHSGIRHSVFCASQVCEWQDTESRMLLASPTRVRRNGRRAGLPTVPMYTCFMVLPSQLFQVALITLSSCHCCSPVDTTHHFLFFFYLSFLPSYHSYCIDNKIPNSSSYLMAGGFVVGAVLLPSHTPGTSLRE